MKCFKCGSDNDESAVFCSRCGVKLSTAATGGGIEKMGVAPLVIYTLFTAGIYAAIWFMKRIDAFNALKSETKLTNGPFGFMLAVCIVNLGVVFYAVFAGVEPDSLFMKNITLTSNMLGMAFQLTLLIQCIKVRRIITDHMNATGGRGEDEISLFYMVLWGLLFPAVFYLQYKLNRLNLSNAMGGFKVDGDIGNT